MAGWIKIHRKITENPLYFSEEFTRLQAWIDLLLIANYNVSFIYVRGNKVEIKRGQIAKSQDALAERWKWSRGKVLRFLSELQKEGQIVQQKSNVINLISIVNYEYYQEVSTAENTTDDTADSIADEPQAVQQTVRVIKEDKEDKEIKEERESEIIPPSPASNEAEAPKPKKNEKLPAKEIKDLWNTICSSFPKLYVLSEARKNKIRVRIEEMGGTEKAMPLIKQIFEKAQTSKFLKGDNKKGWKASFDWLFENDKNWVKVLEGNYEDSTSKNDKNGSNSSINDIWQ